MKSVIVVDPSLFARKCTKLYCYECDYPLGLYDLAFVKRYSSSLKPKYYCLDCAKIYFTSLIRDSKYYLPISKSVRYLVKRLSLYISKRKLNQLLNYNLSHGVNTILRGEVYMLDVQRLKALSTIAKEFFRESNPKIEIVLNERIFCSCCHKKFENKEFVFIGKKTHYSHKDKYYCIDCAPRVFNLYTSKRNRNKYVPINDTIKYVINRVLEVYTVKELIRTLEFSPKRRCYITHIMNNRVKFIALEKLKILNELFKNLENVRDVRIEVWSNRK